MSSATTIKSGDRMSNANDEMTISVIRLTMRAAELMLTALTPISGMPLMSSMSTSDRLS